MTNKINQLQQEAMALIKNPLLNDSTTIAQLGPIPAKLQQLQIQFNEIEQEIAHIENLLKVLNPKNKKPSVAAALHAPSSRQMSQNNGRQEQKKIRIEVEGSFFGNRKAEIFCEHMASDTLAKFFTRLYEIKGIEILEKLSRFKVNRRMLLSKNPKADYRYKSGSVEKIYAHQPIGKSGYFVLTSSTTDEKIELLQTVCKQILNLPDRMFKIEKVGKSDWLKDLLG